MIHMLQIYSNVISNNTLISLINAEARLSIDFEKNFHPPRKNPPFSFIDFLYFFQPPLVCSNLHAYYTI